MRLSRIYGAGAAMGWSVAQVKASSMWEFWSAWHGFVQANTPKDAGKLTEAEKDELWADIEALDAPSGPATTPTYLWDGSGFVRQ